MKANGGITDLGLALDNSNHRVQTRMNSDKGAGVNAGSRLDMAFAASDPLSELVWSPHKGLRVKSADSSLADKRPFLVWNVGPTNPILSTGESSRSREDNDNRFNGDSNLIVSHGVDEKRDLARSPGCKANPAYGTSHAHHINCPGEEEMNIDKEVHEPDVNQNDEHLGDHEEANVLKNLIPTFAASSCNNTGAGDQRTRDFVSHGTSTSEIYLAATEPLREKLSEKASTSCSGRIEDVASGSWILGLGIAMAPEDCSIKEYEAPVSPMQGLPPQQESEKEVTGAREIENKDRMSTCYSISIAPLAKLELTDENDMLPLVRKEALVQPKEIINRANSVPLKASPTNSWMDLYRKKGKEIAVSDGNDFAGELNDEESSHESVESCSSTGLSAKGRKRWIEESIAGSKRAKKEIEDSSALLSTIPHYSSFMNWISNIVKGYSKLNQEEDPTLAISLVHSDHHHENDQQAIIAYKENSEVGCKNMGFRTIFQSIYDPSMSRLEPKASRVEYSVVQSKELVLANKMSVEIPPESCPSKKAKSLGKSLISKEIGHAPISENLESISCPRRITPVDAALMQKVNMTDSGGNLEGMSCQLGMMPVPAAPMQKVNKTDSGLNEAGGNLSGPPSKHRSTTPENNSPDVQSKVKVLCSKSKGNHNLSSLWISRFSKKYTSASMKLDHGNQIDLAQFDSAGLTRFDLIQNKSDSPNEVKTPDTRDDINEKAEGVVRKDWKTLSENVEESVAFKEMQGDEYQNCGDNSNPILPTPEFKSSEAMASVFARRLDALKHISPSDIRSETVSRMTTCLVCGRHGHNLHNCMDTTKTEVEALVRNISSYESVKGSSCLCLKCFEDGHWANTCPWRSSRRQEKLKQKVCSLGGYCNMQHGGGNQNYSSFPEQKEGHTANIILCSGKESFLCTEVGKVICNEIENHGQRISKSDHAKKCTASTSGEYSLKENQSLPICNFTGKLKTDKMKGMFDAVRRLQLSRVDILRWMSSHDSLSPLDGFFVRLRMGKWEAGLGGTGYYVATISAGAENENLGKDPNNPITVNVGGVQCSVGVQYVSNHGFLEDELVTWWCGAVDRAAKLPSQEDLKSRIGERIKLGV